MIAALLASVALAAPPSFELRNTGPWFLGGEAAGSLLVGFVLPELVAPAQGVSCDTNAWCDTNAFDESVTAALRATVDPFRRSFTLRPRIGSRANTLLVEMSGKYDGKLTSAPAKNFL